jgi:site-specific recombinase XerD
MTSIKILFVLDKIKANRLGLAPLRCRITYLGERKPFATGLFVNPKHWDSKSQLAKPPNEDNNFINAELSLIKNKINQAFLFLQVQGLEFDVEDIYKQYKGEPIQKQLGIVQFYSSYLERLKKMISKDFKQSTWEKFNEILPAIKDYILFKYQKKDISLNKLDYNFIEDFDYYLRTEKNNSQVTINKKIQRLKKVIKVARKQKLIDFNPFEEHKPKQAKTKIIFLTQDELDKLKEKEFQSEILNKVRDCYIFCCYTGLGYSEMFSLKKSDLKKDDEGTLWIYKERQKTERAFSIPLIFSEPLEIIEKYKSESEYLLPRISNQYFNRLLKEIAFSLGITKKLTHHTARKTFATTVLLNNNIPIETVSKLLGHSKITTTLSYYAEVMPSKLKLDLEGLRNRLEK